MNRKFIDKDGNSCWNQKRDNGLKTYEFSLYPHKAISICTQTNIAMVLKMLPKGYDVQQASKSIDALKVK